MKLFLAPGACSLSPHIALHEAGLDFQAVTVDFATKRTSDGRDFNAINPKGYVPALELGDGTVLTEGPAIVQYIADQAPASHLAPPNGTVARYQLQEWLGFINSELHKPWGPLWRATATDEAKAAAREAILRRLTFIAKHLEKQPWLLGDTFSVADGYLYVMLLWAKFTAVDLSSLPVLEAYRDRIAARPAVAATHASEKALRSQK